MALLCSLYLVALALNPSLVVVSQQVVRTTYDSLVVDLLVEGPALVGDEWRLAGLGSRPVVVKRMASRRRPAPSAAVLALTPSTRVPAPSRPLSPSLVVRDPRGPTWCALVPVPPAWMQLQSRWKSPLLFWMLLPPPPMLPLLLLTQLQLLPW